MSTCPCHPDYLSPPRSISAGGGPVLPRTYASMVISLVWQVTCVCHRRTVSVQHLHDLLLPLSHPPG